MKRIFWDMDGVVARFYDEVQYLERMWEKDFFLNLNPYENVINCIKYCVKKMPDAEHYILSAGNPGTSAFPEKKQWLDLHLPEIPMERRIFMNVGESKAAAVPGGITKNDHLIDDYTVNILDWEENGGTGIKLLNNVNGKGRRGPEWNGATLCYDDTVTSFCMNLSNILNIPCNWIFD